MRETLVARRAGTTTRPPAAASKPAAPGARRSPRSRQPHFTHFDAAGRAHMVDVGDKAVTRRLARAGGRIAMQPATLALIRGGTAKKGDVLGVARVAAIQAAKRASELIPLCHPLPLTRVAVEFAIDARASAVEI